MSDAGDMVRTGRSVYRSPFCLRVLVCGCLLLACLAGQLTQAHGRANARQKRFACGGGSGGVAEPSLRCPFEALVLCLVAHLAGMSTAV